MKSFTENGALTVYLEGKIDSTNAPATEAELENICEKENPADLILDADALEYISSAGLRVILRFRKKYEKLKIINVSSEVFEVFEMTGFSEMMTVEKGYRKFSVDGCEIIGRGANGIVYRLDADTIIKVYKNSDALPDIQRERELARKAFVLGIPTAIPYDVVKVDDKFGSVFEMLNAKSFAKLIAEDPSTEEHYTDLFVDLLKKIHSTEVKKGDMPDMKEVVLGWARFVKDHIPEDEADKLYRMVEAIPERNTMIHGDYHMRNIMLQNGEVLLIDMDTLSLGNPVFEFASIFLGFAGFGELDHGVTLEFMGIPYDIAERIWHNTVKKYFGITDENEARAYEEKAMIIGYTRMLRRTVRRDGYNTEEGRAIIENCKKRLHELLSKVDSLSF